MSGEWRGASGEAAATPQLVGVLVAAGHRISARDLRLRWPLVWGDRTGATRQGPYAHARARETARVHVGSAGARRITTIAGDRGHYNQSNQPLPLQSHAYVVFSNRAPLLHLLDGRLPAHARHLASWTRARGAIRTVTNKTSSLTTRARPRPPDGPPKSR